jgi:hypothetical protein
MLDWTFNLTVAVYFALFGTDHGDAAVWSLDLSNYPFPREMGRQLRGGGFNLEKINEYGRGVVASFAQPVSQPVYTASAPLPAPIQPLPEATFVVWKPNRAADERLVKQDGLLSWYHSFDDSDVVWNYSEHIKEMEVKSNTSLLGKFTIESSKRDQVRQEVLKRGFNEHFVFTDLDGLGKRLTRELNEEMVRNAIP